MSGDGIASLNRVFVVPSAIRFPREAGRRGVPLGGSVTSAPAAPKETPSVRLNNRPSNFGTLTAGRPA